MYDSELDKNGGFYEDPTWNPIDNSPQPQQGPPGAGYLTYDLLGFDGMTDVYRGSDGKLYKGDKAGPNGFSPYTGTATTFTPNPTKAAAPPPPNAPGSGPTGNDPYDDPYTGTVADVVGR